MSSALLTKLFQLYNVDVYALFNFAEVCILQILLYIIRVCLESRNGRKSVQFISTHIKKFKRKKKKTSVCMLRNFCAEAKSEPLNYVKIFNIALSVIFILTDTVLMAQY